MNVKPHTRVWICYKNFSKDCSVSHIGLGVTAAYTAKTLTHAGIDAQAKAIFGGDDLWKLLAAEDRIGKPVTHIVVCAQWIPTSMFAKLCMNFPHKKFALNCHSNVGFLQAEPKAIKLLREAIDLETGMTNFFAGGNNLRFCQILGDMYGRPIQFLPNLYFLHGKEPIYRPLWQGGVLKVGCFGSLRTYKNFSTAVAAAIDLGFQLRTPVEIWINGGRSDGHGNIVFETAQAWTCGLPNVELKQFPWDSWPAFKRQIGSMNILLQPSYTETFNNVTADGVAEGVPSVVSDTIDWCPSGWQASSDDPKDVSNTARRLLYDPMSAREGYVSLVNYVETGISYWIKFLNRP